MKKNYMDIISITGSVKLTRNTAYGYTAKVESMVIRYKDGSVDTYYNAGRKDVHSGCGYDKTEHAIHTTLSKFVTGIPSTCNFPTYENFTMSGRDFFRTHWFEFTMGSPDKMWTIELY